MATLKGKNVYVCGNRDRCHVAGMGWHNTGGNGPWTAVWQADEHVNGLHASVSEGRDGRSAWILFRGNVIYKEGGSMALMLRDEAMAVAMRRAIESASDVRGVR